MAQGLKWVRGGRSGGLPENGVLEAIEELKTKMKEKSVEKLLSGKDQTSKAYTELASLIHSSIAESKSEEMGGICEHLEEECMELEARIAELTGESPEEITMMFTE